MESFEDEDKLFLYYEGILYTAVGKYKIIFPKIDMTIDELKLIDSLSFSYFPYNDTPLKNFAEQVINRSFKPKCYDISKHITFRPQWFEKSDSNNIYCKEVYNKDGSASLLKNEEIFFTIIPIGDCKNE